MAVFVSHSAKSSWTLNFLGLDHFSGKHKVWVLLLGNPLDLRGGQQMCSPKMGWAGKRIWNQTCRSCDPYPGKLKLTHILLKTMFN